MRGDFVLALSWEPAFCETSPRLPECQSQSAQNLDAKQFSLHGLWPVDTYCGVDAKTRQDDERHDWEALPPVELSKETGAALDAAMPGAVSLLDRHEWIKHGTCSGVDAESYFSAALALADEVNRGSLPEMFTGALGDTLPATRIAAALTDDFGSGSGTRASLECVTDGSRRLISGLRIALSGEIGPDPDISALISAAAAKSGACKSGIVDPAGLQ